ncbi:MAG: flippase-like domain-containing protein [Reichenbachiella sp.]
MIRTHSKELIEHPRRVKLIFVFWGYLVPLIVLIVVLYKIEGSSVLQVFGQMPDKDILLLFCASALVPLNVYLESCKWFLIIRKSSRVSVVNCVKIVLAGKSLNLISPMGLGDGFVKYINFEKKERSQSLALILVDRISNMIPTLILGIVATVFLISLGVLHLSNLLIWVISLVVTIAIIGILISVFIQKNKKRFLKYVNAILKIDWLDFLSFLLLASSRYLVFSFQFYLIMVWVGLDLSFWVLLLAIFWIFFIKTIIPDLTVFGDLVKREISAITFFSLFLPSMELIILANVCIWIVNIIVPSVIGMFFLREYRKLEI